MNTRRMLGRIRQIADNMQRSVAILQDLQGPKIRVGKLAEDPIELEEGSRLTVTTREVPGDAACVSTTYARLPPRCEARGSHFAR